MESGFTLIELLIVITVISVLAVSLIALINPSTQLKRARDTQRKSDLSRIQSSVEIYRADLNVYPCNPPGPGCFPVGCGLPLEGGTPPVTYMNRVACDPVSPPIPYIYRANPALTNYCLRTCLENNLDIDRDFIKYGANNPGNAATGCSFIAADDCLAGTSSYTVVSP